MERESNPMQPMCRSGCGFYGNPATDGLCSVCYKDSLRKKQQPPVSSTSVTNVSSPQTTPTFSPAITVTNTAQPTVQSLQQHNEIKESSQKDNDKVKSSNNRHHNNHNHHNHHHHQNKKILSNKNSSSASLSSSTPTTTNKEFISDAGNDTISHNMQGLNDTNDDNNKISEIVNKQCNDTETETNKHNSMDFTKSYLKLESTMTTKYVTSTNEQHENHMMKNHQVRRKRKISEDSLTADNTTAGPSTSTNNEEEDKDEGDKDAKKKKNRCAVCRKKVGLTGFECRCGGLFCAVHRYSDKHDCTFDYREHGAQEIRRNNPVVVGEKIQKI